MENKFKRIRPKVSIVIPSWFTPTQHGRYGKHETFWFAGECLHRLLEVTPTELFELIIIDNGSTLSSSDLQDHFKDEYDTSIDISKLDKDFKYFTPENYWHAADITIRNKINLGFGPACNQGFALARGEFIVCLNNDILVWEGWLETMLEDFVYCEENLHPPCGVLMPALEKTHKDAREELKLKTPDLSKNKGQFAGQAEFGSLWMIKKSLMDELKQKDGYYFDEQFLGGFQEDRDLWRRIRQMGYETYRTHNTRVYHLGNLTMSKLENRKIYTNANREKFKKKWNIK